MYKKSLEQKRSEFASLETARERGKAEGKAEGLAEGEAKGLAEGKAKGLAEGKAKGLAEGKAKGLAEGKAKERAIIKRLLVSNTLSVSEISKVLEMDPETVEEINASL